MAGCNSGTVQLLQHNFTPLKDSLNVEESDFSPHQIIYVIFYIAIIEKREVL